MRTMSARLPAEPILAYPLRPLALQMAARHGGKPVSHARLLARARAEGSITLGSADKVATALGTHPLCLWGRAWEHAGTTLEERPGQAPQDDILLPVRQGRRT
jgi:hypothetical protein